MPDDVVAFGLGGNHVGSEVAIGTAIGNLQGLGSVIGLSSLYLTEPQDFADQPKFLNAVLIVQVADSFVDPQQLIRYTLETETLIGRVRDGSTPKGPRLIDIDILLIGRRIIQTDTLLVPHPAMQKRRFVLEPLLEIAPSLRDPRNGKLFSSYLTETENQGIYSAKPLNYNAQSL